MEVIAKVHRIKNGKVMFEDRIAFANGEYVLLKDYEALEDKAKKLKCELDKTYNQLMEVEKEAQEHIAELESELEIKDNLLKIKNGLSKKPNITVIVVKTINGQDYVKLEDFMSVMDDLQNCHSDHAE